MPYRRRSRRRRRRRTYRRKRMSRRRRRRSGVKSNRLIVRRWPMNLPDALVVPLRYDATLHWTASGSYVFAGNDLNDPNVTGIGHQPMFYDFLKETYGRMYVFKSSISVKFSPYSDSGVCQMSVIPARRDLTLTFPTSITRQRELPRSKTRIIGNPGATKYASIRMTQGTRKMFDLAFDYASVISTPDVTPTQLWYWNLGMTSFTGQGISGHMDLTLVYHVRFMELNRNPTTN